MTSPTTEATPSVRSDRPPAAPPVKAPEKKGRGRKPGTEAKVRPDIPADEFQLIRLPEKEKADLRRKREERKPQQKAVDEIVYQTFEENVSRGFENGTIADWVDLYVYDWPVSKTNAENAEFMLRKGCTLYNRRLILGEQVEVKASETHDIPDIENPGSEIACHLNGREHIHIVFSVVRRPRKSRA